MSSEGRFAGSGVAPRPAREGRREYSADRSPEPEVPIIDDPWVVAAIARASDLDRGWFKRHPSRAYRIRRMIPGEHPPEVLAFGPHGWPIYTLVKQLMPGCRMRVPFKFRQTPAASESFLAAVWEQFTHERTRQIALDMAAAMMRHRS